MKYQFCTLFNRDYLFRGLALYNSLKRNCPDFKLWILCMDKETYRVLYKMQLKNIILIKLEKFEDKELRRVKPERTLGEYCWTCTSSLCLYILKKNPQFDKITYLDADLYFYVDPAPIYSEFGDNSILIISHRYSQEYKYLEELSGIYNVSWMTFRNNQTALTCLEWWRNKCLEWCFSKPEKGRFGDQMYLNDWPTRFIGVYELKHLGANLAPWNILNYQISEKNGRVMVDEDVLIFYHFHTLEIFLGPCYKECSDNYYICPINRRLIYSPYLSELNQVIKTVQSFFPKFTHGFKTIESPGIIKKNITALRSTHVYLKYKIPLYSKVYKNLKDKLWKK